MDQKPSIPPLPIGRKPVSRLPSLGIPGKRHASHPPLASRRASVTSLTSGKKVQRTSKTAQKLVVLPSAPQTKPLVVDREDDLTLGFDTIGGIREYKSAPERMRKDQRKLAGYKRITAYCIAESFMMKLLSTFLKREHNVSPRIFDEAIYAMYHLPLLPGYGPNSNIRSSAPPTKKKGDSVLAHLSEAEENGYQGTYFTSGDLHSPPLPGFMESPILESRQSTPRISRPQHLVLLPSEGGPDPIETDGEIDPGFMTEPEAFLFSSNTDPDASRLANGGEDNGDSILDPGVETDPGTYGRRWRTVDKEVFDAPEDVGKGREREKEEVAEVVFFDYGVVVFFGLEERQEMDILEDMKLAGIVKRALTAEDWEIEEFNYTHDPHIAYPRIYNDFFTLKSRSHLLKLSIAHALAQSTLLARYEETARLVLTSPLIVSIPTQLAEKGALHLRRHEALKITGRLFKLRRDVNLMSNVLDIPELFWNEASLKALYDAVREYMEIKPRVEALNEKLGVASGFLDAIHDHLNDNAMHRITWIVIWLIVAAVLVEFGEIIARLVFHNSTTGHGGIKTVAANAIRRLVLGKTTRTL